MRATTGATYGLILAAMLTAGCQGSRMGGLNPFHRADRASFALPEERLVAIRAKKSLAGSADQDRTVQELVTQLASENDPLIREAILQTTATFDTPLAKKAVLAGLEDPDQYVRISSCKLLSSRPNPDAAEALSAIVQGDESFDVRVAAARALGSVSQESSQLAPVLEDNNPAMQLVGVQAMRRLTGQDLGGDVAAYRAVARGETPAASEKVSVANRATSWIPFF